jgi:hypothetical protein
MSHRINQDEIITHSAPVPICCFGRNCKKWSLFEIQRKRAGSNLITRIWLCREHFEDYQYKQSLN